MVSRLDRNQQILDPIAPRVDDGKTQRALDSLQVALRAVIKFLIPFVQPEKWALAQFFTGWGDYPSTVLGRVASRKDPLGRVYLRGHAARSAGVTTEIFSLPQGHRPSSDTYFTVYSAGAAGTVYVTPGGVVNFYTGTATDVSLEGVSFDTEA